MSIYQHGRIDPKPHPSESRAVYMAQRGANAVCSCCRKDFIPRIRNGPNAEKFCSTRCHDAFWNARRTQKQSPPADGVSAEGRETTQRSAPRIRQKQPIRKDTKIASVLAELARGNRLTRFDAERLCYDHVLNSTISEIEKRGITVSREEVTVPGHRGSTVRCSRYWLDPAETEKAAVLLGWCKVSA